MIIEIKDGVPQGNPIMDENLRWLHPNVSFPVPLTPSSVEPFGFGVYEQTETPQVGEWEKAVEITPVMGDDGIWRQTWKVEPLTPEERRNKEQSKRYANKMSATAFLDQSDWSVLPDVKLANKADWETYRDELRIIARNPPVDVSQWPVKPQEIWED